MQIGLRLLWDGSGFGPDVAGSERANAFSRAVARRPSVSETTKLLVAAIKIITSNPLRSDFVLDDFTSINRRMARLIYYMDETGNRHPDKKSTQERAGRDWFGLGGYLLKSDDKGAVRALHEQFCNEWNINQPFHITDMLAAKKKFAWLGNLSDRERSRFWEEYKDMLSSIPALGTGCIISRPGYVARGYVNQFPNSKWLLCRSAFDITIERAAKYAQSVGAKLDVVFEADGPLNETMKGYFKNLKLNGLSFDAGRSAKYNAFTQQDFSNTLGTIEYKAKSSPYLQFADSYIYAIARQKYDRHFGVYCRLRDRKRIINFALGDADTIKSMGIKYYCFD